MNIENITLLYAEDEIELRNSMRELLSDEVKELYIAKNGQEAYEIYKDKKPDILLLDINMPNLSGIEVLKKIRENDHTTRAIMLTAHSDIDNLLKATELKLTKYLVKPFSGDELFGAIDLAIEELTNFSTICKKQLFLEDNFIWDFATQTLSQNDNEIRLTPKEKQILDILFSNLDGVISYDTLLMDVWDDFEQSSLDTLKTMMKNIRRKLPKDTIQNVYATGYKVLSNHY